VFKNVAMVLTELAENIKVQHLIEVIFNSGEDLVKKPSNQNMILSQ
jgi:hypothetical protein